MKKQYLLFCSIMFLCLPKNYAQDMPKEKVETKRLTNLLNQLEGTYQVQIIDSREKLTFPLTMLDSVQIKRQQNQTTYIWLKSNVRVMVPAYSVINKQGFSPLERVKYISSSEQ